MPCYTVNTVELNMEKLQHKYLAGVAAELGLKLTERNGTYTLADYSVGGIRIYISGKQIQFVGSKAEAFKKKFKVAYSTAIVKAAAKANRWMVKTTNNPQKFYLRK